MLSNLLNIFVATVGGDYTTNIATDINVDYDDDVGTYERLIGNATADTQLTSRVVYIHTAHRIAYGCGRRGGDAG